jgi:hypothetical protein
MKKLIYLILPLIALNACTKQIETEQKTTEFKNVHLPDFMKASDKSEYETYSIVEAEITAYTPDREKISGTIRFTMPDTPENTLLKLEITDNIFQQTHLSPKFLLEAEEKGFLNSEKSSCIASCQEQFTDDNGNKLSGLGWCKAECWAKTIISAASTIIAAVIASS